MKIFDYEEVKMNWDSFTYPIAVGTPVSIDGGLADNASAHGLIARTVFAKPDADETLKVMTGGFIDMEEIVAGYGHELSSAAVQALCGIHFYKNGVCIPSGGSGGGGVTPEIMAQIENAQWKTETSEQLFSETVTTVAEKGGNAATLSYAEPITADTLKVTFNGVEYTCSKNEMGNGVAYGGVGSTGPDFTEFPFSIISNREGKGNSVFTENAGTFTVSASTKTVTTTDTFKKAVRSLSGAVEVENLGEADVAIVYIPNPETVSTNLIKISSTGTPTITLEENPIFFGGINILYRQDTENLFSNSQYELKEDYDYELTLYAVSPQTSSHEAVYLIPNVTHVITDNDIVKFYSLGLPHTIDVDGGDSEIIF